jgi:hypothetical protein
MLVVKKEIVKHVRGMTMTSPAAQILEGPCRDVYIQHCIQVAKSKQVVTDQKQEVLDMDAFDQRDKCRQHPSKLYSRKVSKLVLHACVAEKAARLSAMLRMSRAPRSGSKPYVRRHNDVRKEHIVNERTTEGGK